MSSNIFIQPKQKEFQNAIDFFKKDTANLRVGRANPAMLDSVWINIYGAKNPINSLANISVQDAKSMIVTPWDKKIIKDIEKAIVEAELGVSVINEGDKIRIAIPQTTEENRKELIKKLREKMEKARISVRQIRDAIKEDIEKAEKNKEISNDNKFIFIKELDEITREKNDDLKTIEYNKEKDIMTI
ncbi:MAG: ribosome recycling factor [Patescibacteria group bacterium]